MCEVTKARQAERIAPKGQKLKRRREHIRAVARAMADSMDRDGVKPPRWAAYVEASV
jgi:hypothetical protein